MAMASISSSRPNGGKVVAVQVPARWQGKVAVVRHLPEVPLALARARRDRSAELVAAGTDPSAARKRSEGRRSSETRSVRSRRYRSGVAGAPRSRMDAGTLRGHHGLTRESCLPDPSVLARSGRSRRATSAGRAGRSTEQGAGETAGRVFQRLRSIYRYAISEDLVEADPRMRSSRAEIFRPRDVNHRLALAEAGHAGILRQARCATKAILPRRRALELLILTAVRPGELRGARWEEIDNCPVTLANTGERMKMAAEHLVPLSTQALAVLEGMKGAERRP